jgi:prolyl oligopeptidase
VTANRSDSAELISTTVLPRQYPEASRLKLVQRLHGLLVPDPYRWLEDEADQRTSSWIGGQDALYQAERADWEGRDRWESDVAALITADRVWPPKIRGDRFFLQRRRAGQDHPVLFVSEAGAQRPVLDPLALDPAGDTMLDTWTPSVEGTLLAYQLSAGGTENSLLQVLNVDTGQVIDGPIDRVRSTPIAWLPGGEMFYYVRRLPPELHPGEERYHRRVYLHLVGSDPSDDILVFGEGRGKTQFYTVAVTPDGRWLTVAATSGTAPATDLFLADLALGGPEQPRFRPVGEGVRARSRLHARPGTAADDVMWLRTDHEAPRGRVVACSPRHTDAGGWRELIAERPDAVLTDFTVLSGPDADHPVGLVTWARHAVAEITVHSLTDGTQLGTVPLPGAGSVGSLSVRLEGGHEAWFAYTDHTTRPTVLCFDERTGGVRAWPQQDPGLVVAGATLTQEAFPSRDGTTVRMFVMSPAGRPDRPRPAILAGYGGFGASMSPRFLPDAMAWVRAGGVYAVACLRGGGEEGEGWHRAGQRELKQNSFDDFDAAADFLAEAGWTGPGQLGIMGGSNGGLLVGAAITQHPEKYAAAVCLAPLLDMVRYELSGLGPSWRSEYGSADDPVQLRTLLSYSPYHRVVPGVAYPPVLFAAFDGDTRVDPLHARKMCAALQYASSGTGPVLLRLERGAGHGGRSVSREAALSADCLAFLGAHLGLVP